jgi:DNA-binding PadR family transcriptional regulator
MREQQGHWLRHMAIVPKGFIRYQVLEALSEKPMSGSEIMDHIQKRTNGRWKPSPGSVYPLLASLQESGCLRELPTDENGLKRYEVTGKGKQFLDAQRKIRKQLRKQAKLFAPPFLGALWFRIPPEKTSQVRDSMHRLMSAFFELGGNLEEKFSEEILDETCEVLDETAEKLEKINRKMKVDKNE